MYDKRTRALLVLGIERRITSAISWEVFQLFLFSYFFLPWKLFPEYSRSRVQMHSTAKTRTTIRVTVSSCQNHTHMDIFHSSVLLSGLCSFECGDDGGHDDRASIGGLLPFSRYLQYQSGTSMDLTFIWLSGDITYSCLYCWVLQYDWTCLLC